MIPICDGLELIDIIRHPGANANPYVPIIMLSGPSVKKRGMSAREPGINEFRAAHDIKGEATTFGLPTVASVANNLYPLIELTPDSTRMLIKLVNQHVDAICAIYREYARSDTEKLAGWLSYCQREVTDDFLECENVNRPEVLEQIRSPSIAP